MRTTVNNVTSAVKWRFERKFVVTDLSRQEVRNIIFLHPAMFSEIHNQRFVNNLYMDTVSMRSYFENVDGVCERTKVRIRWYGDLLGKIEKPVLELKIKNGLLGTKEQYQLEPFFIGAKFEIKDICGSINKSNIPLALKEELKLLKPVLLNRYTRNYYQSVDKHYRITVDTGLTSFRISHFTNSLLDKRKHSNEIIVELKYREEIDCNVDCVTKFLPFRLTKSSKYVCGVERLY